ncbi:MAG: ASCH domain-containing protein [Flavobacteriales bacterium]|nr:ASCH domain-containing protein [Flavobacteriales bacterium]
MGIIHPSIHKMWAAFCLANREYKEREAPNSFYFCDNQPDADQCAELVVKEIKQATAASLWSYEHADEVIPQNGDLFIVTNWAGEAKAIIRTSKIEQVPYHHISAEFARIEGEGDKSLEYWRKVHWDYFSREMKPHQLEPSQNMIIVCEHFETLWPKI